MSQKSPAQAAQTSPELRGQFPQLLLATLASAVGFWAWMLISPIQTHYAELMKLGEGQISLMLATPVLVGALGRIVIGSLTDRFGARKMFTVVLLASVPAVLLVALAGTLGSFALLIASGTYLGIAGTIFAVGVPFASAWYEPRRRGFANGVFGMGMIGTAVSAFFTPGCCASSATSKPTCSLPACWCSAPRPCGSSCANPRPGPRTASRCCRS